MNTNINRFHIEFFLIYLLVPISIAGLVATETISATFIPLVFLLLFVISLLLLNQTQGFQWRSLMMGKLIPDWRFTLLFIAGTTCVATVLTLSLVPECFLLMPQHIPQIWLAMTIVYPILSVVPQGIIYRALFFERYASLFPSPKAAMATHAIVFGLAHLFYLNGVAVALTIMGGLIFAWAYVEKKSFMFAVLLHAIAGWILFTTGLGSAYFYHGTIPAGS